MFKVCSLLLRGVAVRDWVVSSGYGGSASSSMITRPPGSTTTKHPPSQRPSPRWRQRRRNYAFRRNFYSHRYCHRRLIILFLERIFFGISSSLFLWDLENLKAILPQPHVHLIVDHCRVGQRHPCWLVAQFQDIKRNKATSKQREIRIWGKWSQLKKMPKIDTLDALEEQEEHDDDYQTNSNW